MTKTISARVNNDLHTKLVEVCNDLGLTMNELLNRWIKNQIHAHPDPHEASEVEPKITIENI